MLTTRSQGQSDLVGILGLPYACSVTLGKLLISLLLIFLISRTEITYLPHGAVKIKIMNAKGLELFLVCRKCSVSFSRYCYFYSYSNILILWMRGRLRVLLAQDG